MIPTERNDEQTVQYLILNPWTNDQVIHGQCLIVFIDFSNHLLTYYQLITDY